MVKLILCRHGQDEDNASSKLNGHRNTPLTILGQSQARTVADKLRSNSQKIDAVLTSPLQRASHTAARIAEALGLPLHTNDLLIERDFGVLSSRLLSDIPTFSKSLLKTEKVTYFIDSYGAETFDELYVRATKLVSFVERAYCGKEAVVLVCHGDIGKMIAAVRRQISWEEALHAPFIDNTGIVEL